MLPYEKDMEGAVEAAELLESSLEISSATARSFFREGALTEKRYLDIVADNVERICESGKETKLEMSDLDEADSVEVKGVKSKSKRKKWKILPKKERLEASRDLWEAMNPSYIHLTEDVVLRTTAPIGPELHPYARDPFALEKYKGNYDKESYKLEKQEKASVKKESLELSESIAAEDSSENSSERLVMKEEELSAEHEPDVQTLNESCPFSLSDFEIPARLQEWIDAKCQPSLFLIGEAGTGKSMFCYALAKAKNYRVLTVNHPDSIRELKADHDMVLFDDLNFKEIDPIQLLAFIDTTMQKTIRVLHGTVVKPKGKIQAFTLNKDVARKLRNMVLQDQYLRRMHVVELHKPILVNINVNLTQEFHIHNHIYNNKENIEENRRILKNL